MTLFSTAMGDESATKDFAHELHDQGWIVFSSVTPAGDWDLFAMRPDGSDRVNLTNTREFSETGARYSADGKRLLYYRQKASEAVDNNTYGMNELILADIDGSDPVSFGTKFPWATWGKDSSSFAALTSSGIQVIDVVSRKIVRSIPRKGLVQQLVWSPDGKSFLGTANGLGPFWNIGVLNLDDGKIVAVSETERYNCTPDWLPDSQRVLYARGIIPSQDESKKGNDRAELWISTLDGSKKRMVYAEGGRHIYGGASSPDSRYYLFTRSVEDLGKVDHATTTMSIIRAADTPMLGDNDDDLRRRYPNSKPVQRLDLGPGWEPQWTSFDVLAKSNAGETK